MSCGGGISPQPPPVCSIHLDDATAATGQRHQCARHTRLQVQRRESHRIKCMRSPHTSYRWRGESQSEIKCMLSQPAKVERGERHRPNQEYALATHQLQVERERVKGQSSDAHHNQLQVERRERHRPNQVYALATHQLQVERRERHRANQVMRSPHTSYRGERRERHRQSSDALATHQLQVERRESSANQVYALTTTSYRWRGERDRANQVYALATHQLQVERRESSANQV